MAAPPTSLTTREVPDGGDMPAPHGENADPGWQRRQRRDRGDRPTPTANTAAEPAAAVLVIHGIGQQQPAQTLAQVVDGLQRLEPGTGLTLATPRVDGVEHPRAELSLRSGGGRLPVHVYEAYLAPHTQDKATIRQAMAFLASCGLRGLRRAGRPYRRWLFNRQHDFGQASAATQAVFLLALLVLGGLAAFNLIVAAVAAATGAEGVGLVEPGSWPGPGVIEPLTSAAAVLVLAIASLGLVVWACARRTAQARRLAWEAREHASGPGGGAKVLEAEHARRVAAAYGRMGMAWFAVTCIGLVACAAAAVALVTPGRVPGEGWVARAGTAPSWTPWAIGAVWAALAYTTARVRRILVETVGDVAAYVGTFGPSRLNEARQAVRESVARTARHIVHARLPDGRLAYDRIAVVGHSLGSVVAYDTLNELWCEAIADGKHEGLRQRIRLLLTFGSPLDKLAFVAGYQGNDTRELLLLSREPMVLDYRYRVPWVNIHAGHDIVSGKVDFFDVPDGPAPLRVRNVPDPLALTPLAAHVEYWDNPLVWDELRAALAKAPEELLDEVTWTPQREQRVMSEPKMAA